jgi:hypothetical protein
MSFRRFLIDLAFGARNFEKARQSVKRKHITYRRLLIGTFVGRKAQ